MIPFIFTAFFWLYDFHSGLGTGISRNATLQYKRPEKVRVSTLFSVLLTMV